jgi:hypothetical protein
MALAKTTFVTSMMALLAWSGLSSAQGTPPAPAPAPAPAVAPAPAPAAAPAPAPVAGAEPVRPDLGEVGAFVIDQVSGFRGRVGGGVGFYGPIGLAYNTFEGQSGTQVNFTGTTASASSTQTTINSWSLWLAPSIDYFIAPNISVGGLFAVDTTFGSAESKTSRLSAAGTVVDTSKIDLPSVTSFTLMPRVGYFIRMDTRLSFWPRLGLGYFSGSNASVQTGTDGTGKTVSFTQNASISSLLFQLDLGVIYQITDNVFFRIAPAVSFSYDGSSKVRYEGVNVPDQTGTGKAFQFELTSGFGANFSL